jgi:hypothetical protein
MVFSSSWVDARARPAPGLGFRVNLAANPTTLTDARHPHQVTHCTKIADSNLLLKIVERKVRLAGGNMEPVAAEKQNVTRSQSRAINIMLAFSTTVVVGLTVVEHWGTYDWIRRFVGVVLLLNLLFSLRELMRKKEGRNLEWFVSCAYSWVLLATILFNH